MRLAARLFLFVVAISVSDGIWAAEPLWRKALSGEIAAPPAVAGDRVYVVTQDRMITCLSENGGFLWSRPLPGKPAPFLFVASTGLVLAASKPGILTAYNPDGNFLWQLRGTDLPIFSPKEGRDGRIFLMYQNSVICLTGTGGVKWTLPVDNQPLSFGAESGDGDLLVPCAGKVILRISPFGELLEKIAVASDPCAMAAIPNGFVAGFPDGTIRAFEVRNGRHSPDHPDSEPVWEYRGQGVTSALSYGNSAVLVLDSLGLLSAVNETDGAFLWSLSAGIPAAISSVIAFDYGQFTITGKNGIWASTGSGQTVWSRAVREGLFSPVLSDRGIAYTATADWVIEAWRIEARIKNEKKTQNGGNYSILNGKSAEYGIPYGFTEETTASLLGSVTQDISDGTVGPREVNYARRLSEILRDDVHCTEDERARAATLLGKLGSTEYRNFLESEASGARTTTLATGILFGLASCVPDPDGTEIPAIRDIVNQCGSRDETAGRAACDALYAVIRYSSGKTARDGTMLLARFLDGNVTKAVNDHAREKLERLLK